MKTDDLIASLSQDTPRVPRGAMLRLLAFGALPGAAIGLGLVAFGLGLLPLRFASEQLWWLKLTYVAVLGLSGLLLALRLSTPAGQVKGAGLVLGAAAICALTVVSAGTLVPADSAERTAILLGSTWKTCSISVLVVSAPVLAGVLFAMRRAAPTRPALAGAAAGLFAGGVGASLYTLHCAELAPAFVGAWYTLGVVGVTALGAAIGARALRW